MKRDLDAPVGLDGWMERRIGRLPVILYAPHGGRRSRPVRRGDSVNDLYTAELALEIAERIDAHALVNHGLDRNEVDLNRITALCEQKPAVLEALAELVERAAAGGRVPLVLLVHGWNVSTPWCDIGVGLTEKHGEMRGRYPTVSRATFDRTVRGLVDGLSARGLQASIGHHFPASGRDNATQMFSGRYADHDDARVAALAAKAARGSVDAIQLELGIPLRWPGDLRDRFVESVSTVVEEDASQRHREGTTARPARDAHRREWSLPPRKLGQDDPVHEPGIALQAVLDDGSGLFLGAEPTGRDSMAARFCIARPDGSLLLFVAEGPWAGDADRYDVAGFHIERTASGSKIGDLARERTRHGAGESAGDAALSDVREPRAGMGARLRVRYRGPMVRYATHDAFVDLEAGLAEAELIHAEVELTFDGESAKFGTMHGRLRLGEESRRLATVGVYERGGRRTQALRPRTKLCLVRGVDTPCELGGASEEHGPGRVLFSSDAAGVESIVVEEADPGALPMRGRVAIRVPVYRPLPGGATMRVTFGVAEFAGAAPAQDEGSTALGLFERVEILAKR